MKLIDSALGLAVALLSLSSVYITTSSSASLSGQASMMLSREQAVGSALERVSERQLVSLVSSGGGAAQLGPCVLLVDQDGSGDLSWAFSWAGRSMKVGIKCEGPYP